MEPATLPYDHPINTANPLLQPLYFGPNKSSVSCFPIFLKKKKKTFNTATPLIRLVACGLLHGDRINGDPLYKVCSRVLTNAVISFLFTLQLLDWAMSVLKFHAERKSVLEVCSFCWLTTDFFQRLITNRAGHEKEDDLILSYRHSY